MPAPSHVPAPPSVLHSLLCGAVTSKGNRWETAVVSTGHCFLSLCLPETHGASILLSTFWVRRHRKQWKANAPPECLEKSQLSPCAWTECSHSLVCFIQEVPVLQLFPFSGCLSHQYWVNFAPLACWNGHFPGSRAFILKAIASSEKSQWGEIAYNSMCLFCSKVLPQPQSTPWFPHATQEWLGLQTDNWPSCRMRLKGKSHCYRDVKWVYMLLTCERTQICPTLPRFPKSVLHLPCFSPISSPGLEEWKKSGWFPDLPICSEKSITVLTAAHPHESWPEQTGTALHCKKTEPDKSFRKQITSSFVSPQPAPPLAAAQSHGRTSWRKYQTLTLPLVQQAGLGRVCHCVPKIGCPDPTAPQDSW